MKVDQPEEDIRSIKALSAVARTLGIPKRPQFVINRRGKPVKVIVDIRDYERMLAELEKLDGFYSEEPMSDKEWHDYITSIDGWVTEDEATEGEPDEKHAEDVEDAEKGGNKKESGQAS